MPATSATGSHARAGFRAWLGLVVLALPTLLLAIDATVLYLTIPHLVADLAPTASQTLWIIDIYGFMIAGFLITMGTLGDRIGRRRLLMIGAAAFALASVMAAYSTSPEMLILARALLGVAGATLMPSTLALISNLFLDGRQRAMAIGIWAACFSVGVLAGPVVGGALLEYFWWGSVFLMAVPIMVFLLITAPILLPAYRDSNAGRMDFIGVALSLAAILPLIYGLKMLAEHGLNTGVLAILVGIGFGLVFFRRQRQRTDPLLDVRLFHHRPLTAALLALFVGLAAIGVVYMYATQYLQLVVGLSPLAAGLWLLPSAGAMVLASVAAPLIARWVDRGILVGASLTTSTIGYLTLVAAGSDGSLMVVVWSLVVVYLGIGPLMALGTDLVIGKAPPERAGSAGALSETSMEFGLAAGIAVLGSVGTAVYRSILSPAIQDEIPAESAAASLDTLAGALAESRNLSDPAGPSLADEALAAFTTSFHVVAVAGAVAVTATGVLTLLWVRGGKAGADTAATPEHSQLSDERPTPSHGKGSDRPDGMSGAGRIANEGGQL